MRIIVLLLLGIAGFSSANASEQTDIELGRAIFENGIGRDARKINASNQYGADSAVACAGCHGKNGSGGGESFVRAPDIRWFNLTKPYAARSAGAQAAPYTLDAFTKALRNGVSSQGRKLDPVMPKIKLADDEIKSLIAYLQVLSEPERKTVIKSNIIGLLPRSGASPMADALAKQMSECSAAQNGRSAAIDVLRYDQPDDAIEKIRGRLSTMQDTVILAPYLFGWEKQYADFARQNKISTVMPITLLDPPASNGWHYSLPGLESQIARLLGFAKANGKKNILIHYEQSDPLSQYLYRSSLALLNSFSLVEIEAQHEHADGYAELWLKGMPSEITPRAVNKNQLYLVPATFSSAASNKQIPRAAVTIRVAHPYSPKIGQQWQSPVNLWSKTACDFLTQFDTTKSMADQIGTLRLNSSAAPLIANTTFAERSMAVIITDEQGNAVK